MTYKVSSETLSLYLLTCLCYESTLVNKDLYINLIIVVGSTSANDSLER